MERRDGLVTERESLPAEGSPALNRSLIVRQRRAAIRAEIKAEIKAELGERCARQR